MGDMMRSEDAFLARRPANHVPLSPLSFLHRAALAHPTRIATVYGDHRRSWAETLDRCRRLASALRRLGIGPGDVVAVVAANTPELFEAHFAVPMTGGVLNAINFRLDAATIAYILEHGGAKVLLTDTEFAPVVKEALVGLADPPVVIDIHDPAAPGEALGRMDYEALLASGDPAFSNQGPADEWDSITLNYTSGTTGRPRGVLYHHRGAYLLALGNILEWHMGEAPVYLWTLPMFHCNGWCFPWTLAAKAGTSVCLRKVTAKGIYDALADEAVGYLCGAPIVLKIMLDAKPERTPSLFAALQDHDGRGAATTLRPRADEPTRLRRDACLRPDRNLRPRGRVRLASRMGCSLIRGASRQARASGLGLCGVRGGDRGRPDVGRAGRQRRRGAG